MGVRRDAGSLCTIYWRSSSSWVGQLQVPANDWFLEVYHGACQQAVVDFNFAAIADFGQQCPDKQLDGLFRITKNHVR